MINFAALSSSISNISVNSSVAKSARFSIVIISFLTRDSSSASEYPSESSSFLASLISYSTTSSFSSSSDNAISRSDSSALSMSVDATSSSNPSIPVKSSTLDSEIF